MRERIAGLVLAAGASARFGSNKLLARLDGRPLLQHVLDAVAAAGLVDVVVVLGDAADEIERAITWRAEVRVRNPDPGAGLSSSLRVGLAALEALEPEATGRQARFTGALVLLGDQPRVRPAVIGRLVEESAGAREEERGRSRRRPTASADLDEPGRSASEGRPIVIPRYAGGGGLNPVLLRRAAWSLTLNLAGDRGMGPLIATHPELVHEVPVAGDNPDVDTPSDLARLARRAPSSSAPSSGAPSPSSGDA